MLPPDTVVVTYSKELIMMTATTVWQRSEFMLSLGAFGHDEEAQLSSGWILIGSELSSLKFNSAVRAEQSFAIRYPNVVIKFLCGNLDICLNY